MGKEKIEDIMLMGYNSKYCHRASAFEVELAKLITACTIMPTMNVGFDFEKYDDTLNIIFYPTGENSPLMLLFVFVGVVIVILISQIFNMYGAIPPGGVVLCIILFKGVTIMFKKTINKLLMNFIYY